MVSSLYHVLCNNAARVREKLNYFLGESQGLSVNLDRLRSLPRRLAPLPGGWGRAQVPPRIPLHEAAPTAAPCKLRDVVCLGQPSRKLISVAGRHWGRRMVALLPNRSRELAQWLMWMSGRLPVVG